VWHSRAKPGADAASKSTDYAASLQSLEGSILNYPDWVVFDIDPYIYSGQEKPGETDWVHAVAVDSKGNLYAGDIKGKRLQKFVRAN
jgi:bifunctional non-homologous end joining protein LigD